MSDVLCVIDSPASTGKSGRMFKLKDDAKRDIIQSFNARMQNKK